MDTYEKLSETMKGHGNSWKLRGSTEKLYQTRKNAINNYEKAVETQRKVMKIHFFPYFADHPAKRHLYQ